MRFSTDAVQAVFDEYEQRAREEGERMANAPPAGGMPSRDEMLLPVGREAGALLHALVVARRPATVLELGTSYGYSTLILADAARQAGARLITMELADYKQAYARDRISRAGLADVVDFRLGDAVSLIGEARQTFGFVLLDIWKELYLPCFEAFYPKLADEAIVAADNMIEPPYSRPEVRRYRAAVQSKRDLQTVLLPVGSGIELSCRWPAGSTKL